MVVLSFTFVVFSLLSEKKDDASNNDQEYNPSKNGYHGSHER